MAATIFASPHDSCSNAMSLLDLKSERDAFSSWKSAAATNYGGSKIAV